MTSRGRHCATGRRNYHGAYLLYRVDRVADAKASLRRVLPHVTSAAGWDRPQPFTLNLVLTWHGLRALGVPASELDSFPRRVPGLAWLPARRSSATRGASDPANWVQPLGTEHVHIGVIISSSSEDALSEPLGLARAMPGLTCVYELAVGVPPTGA